MAWPTTKMNLDVHMKFDGETWTDVSSSVLYANKIKITQGASNQNSQIDPSSCSFTLKDPNGDFFPDNASGAHFGTFGRNTPVRVSVREGEVGAYFDRLDDGFQRISTPDNAALDITGDIDIAIEAELWNWTDTTSAYGNEFGWTELIAKDDSGSSQSSWYLAVRDGYLRLRWSPDGTTQVAAASTKRLVPTSSTWRKAVRATLDVNNGASGNTVTFYTSDSIEGPWVQFGDPVVQSGTTSLFNSSASLKIGHATQLTLRRPIGKVYKARIRNGIGGTIVANPDFTAQADGTTSFVDSAGRTWTAEFGAEITNRKVRFSGEVSSISPSTTDRNFHTVDVQCGGLMRRLGQNDNTFRSAMYRWTTSPRRSNIFGYWPMEDGEEAFQFSSAYQGGPTMFTSAGGLSKASYSEWGASSPLPTFDTGTASVAIPPYSLGNETSIRFFVAIPSTGLGATRTIASIRASGTIAMWKVQVTSAGALQLQALDNENAVITTTSAIGYALNGVQRMFTLELTQSGANVNWRHIVTQINGMDYIHPILIQQDSGTINSRTVGRVNAITLGDPAGLSDTAMGQLTIANALAAYTNGAGAIVNWYGEPAANRITRAVFEENLDLLACGQSFDPGFPIDSDASFDQRQGGQGETDLLTLCRDAASAAAGLFGEPREILGLWWRAPGTMQSQDPVLSLTYTHTNDLDLTNRGPIVEPFEPTYDDDVTVNDFTAERRDGGSARFVQTEGRLGNQNPPTGVGQYEGSETYNFAAESDCPPMASWMVNLGTFEGPRFSSLTINCRKAVGIIDKIADVFTGDIIATTGVPARYGDDGRKLKVEGYSETLDQFEWEIDFVCSPGEPWDVAYVSTATTSSANEEFTWIDTAGSVLTGNINSTDTVIGLKTTTMLSENSQVWTTRLENYPFDLRIDGEVVTALVGGNLSNANALLDTDASGYTITGGALSWTTEYLFPHPRCRGVGKVVPTGGAVDFVFNTTVTSGINNGGQFQAAAWIYSPLGFNNFQVQINWYDSGGTYISTSASSNTTLAANTPTHITMAVQAPSTAARASVGIRQNAVAASTDIWYFWAVRLGRLAARAVYDNFGRTLTDSWGTTESNQTWTLVGGVNPTDYDVISGLYGRHINQAVSTGHHSIVPMPDPDFDLIGEMTTAALSTGASQFTGLLARYTDIDNLYEARLEYTTANAIILSIRKRVAGVETQLGTYTTGLTHVAGTLWRVRFQGVGTRLRAKVWATNLSSSLEPGWQVDATDLSFTTATNIGFKSVRNAGNTNANADMRLDNFALTNPQSMSVVRSTNGVVASHSAGADVRLNTPARPAI